MGTCLLTKTSGAKRLVGIFMGAFLLVTVVGVTAAHSETAGTTARPKSILLLYSYGHSFQPWVTWGGEIRKELNRRSPWPLSFQEHSLFTAITDDSYAEAEFVEFLTALYERTPPDLILALGAPAARFVQHNRADLFPESPMLLAAVNVRRVTAALLSGRDVVVGTQVEHGVVLDNILRLLPETKTIAMIIGNSPPERFWVDEVQRELKSLSERIELRFYHEAPFGEILAEVANMPPDSAIFFQQMMVDGEGAVYGDKDPLLRIAEVANAPIFTYDQTYFDGSVVGGPMNSPAEGAKSTTAVAVRMLAGEDPGDMHVPPIAFSVPKYDWRQLRRWNISESRLPPGSEVLFRELTAWERYSLQITLFLMAVLLQAGLIAVLLHERSRRRTAEVQSRQRISELAHVNRFAIAGELAASIAHEINQPLGAIMSNAESAQIILASADPDTTLLKEITSEILQNDERATEVIKRMGSLLKKAPFDPEKLELDKLTQETITLLLPLARGREVQLVKESQSGPLPILGDRIQLQQVIVNLVMNAIDAMSEMRPGDRVIILKTARVDECAELNVTDCGPGVPRENLKTVLDAFFTTKANGMGMGLSIARTIVEAHGGKITAANLQGSGASFTVKLPII